MVPLCLLLIIGVGASLPSGDPPPYLGSILLNRVRRYAIESGVDPEAEGNRFIATPVISEKLRSADSVYEYDPFTPSRSYDDSRHRLASSPTTNYRDRVEDRYPTSGSGFRDRVDDRYSSSSGYSGSQYPTSTNRGGYVDRADQDRNFYNNNRDRYSSPVIYTRDRTGTYPERERDQDRYASSVTPTQYGHDRFRPQSTVIVGDRYRPTGGSTYYNSGSGSTDRDRYYGGGSRSTYRDDGNSGGSRSTYRDDGSKYRTGYGDDGSKYRPGYGTGYSNLRLRDYERDSLNHRVSDKLVAADEARNSILTEPLIVAEPGLNEPYRDYNPRQPAPWSVQIGTSLTVKDDGRHSGRKFYVQSQRENAGIHRPFDNTFSSRSNQRPGRVY